jgi:hypothetical protein
VQALGEVFPDVNTNFKNPIDLGEYGYEPRLFARAMRIVLNDQKVGSIVFVREPERFRIISKLLDIPDPQKMTIDSITEVLKEGNGSTKPVLCNPSANKESVDMFTARWEFQKAMIQAGLPVINYIANIPHVLNELYQYGLYLERNRSVS